MGSFAKLFKRKPIGERSDIPNEYKTAIACNQEFEKLMTADKYRPRGERASGRARRAGERGERASEASGAIGVKTAISLLKRLRAGQFWVVQIINRIIPVAGA